ncbi:MAG: type II toxin-antitoxin system YafQ family toxin [bacterium]|nr:type II toxin-antitoxin system YafQ family toxin [bacterium]
MYTLYVGAQFRKDYKRYRRNTKFNQAELEKVFDALQRGVVLGAKYQNHKLVGKFVGCYECHVQPDVLLVYHINQQVSRIDIVRLGSHAELF